MNFIRNKFTGKLKWINLMLSIVILIILGLIMFVPVDVLSCPEGRVCNGDFYLHVDSSKEYAVGDDLVAHSDFLKKRNSNGLSKRYIECKNEEDRFSSRFPIGESDANRPPGNRQSDLYLRVPLGIQCLLPTTCRIAVVVDYPINGLRDLFRGKHIERAYSNEFTCKKNDTPIVELHITVQNGNVAVEGSPDASGSARQIIRVPSGQSTQTTTPQEQPPVNNQAPEEEEPVPPPPKSILAPLPGIEEPLLGCRIGICL